MADGHPTRRLTTWSSYHVPSTVHSFNHLCLLVDPVELGRLVAGNLLRLEPQSNLLLSILDAVGAVADVAANIDGIVTSDRAGGRGKRVGGTKDGWCA